MGIYKDLEGKRVVVTGAARGLGLEAAGHFLKDEVNKLGKRIQHYDIWRF